MVQLSALASVLSLYSVVAAADPACAESAGRLASIEGSVQVQSAGQSGWRPARLGESLCRGDSVRVGPLGRAAVALVNQAVMRLDQNTTVRLIDIRGKKEERSFVELIRGALQSFSRKPRLLSVNTPYLNGSIEGTEFETRVDADQASILVLEGRVVASNDAGSVALMPGERAETRAGGKPAANMVAAPRDAVQWSLHYPPVFLVEAGTGFDALEQVPESARDAGFHVRRAALLLDAGRQSEATAELDAALQKDPRSGAAQALRTVILVVRNESAAAVDSGRRAVALENSPATAVALSYALQSDFQIDAARQVMLEAAASHPGDALVWARLSELQLMSGDKAAARSAAAEAAGIAPGLARVRLVTGFAALSEYRSDAARQAFEQAIEADSSDPLARLGMGLALIASGRLDEGRAEIEIAVALDPNQALLRAYLGKAYFEERRTGLDAQQFAIAKALDGRDPTAYLYDGIRKQTENRPIEAIADLETSAALNDQRAVYRSRLLLDKDQAARGTSVARAYNDAGFADTAVIEAGRSLVTDPANASAHRFLADSYLGVRRREIARVSELTQALMLQDLNLNPIQPSSSEANLNIVTAGGPASAGFNEFTPLFQRNRTQVSASAVVGNHDTLGAEAVVSGLYDRLAFSFGALSHDTDGWRPNNRLKQDVYNAFVQAAVSDTLNLQAEFRHRASVEGDLAFNFDPDDFIANRRVAREQDSARLGLRYAVSPATQVLLSYTHGQRDEDLSESFELAPVVGITTFSNRQRVSEKSDQAEAQLIHAAERMNAVLGAAWTHVRRTDRADVSIDDTVIGNLVTDSGTDRSTTLHPRAYGYVNLRATPAVAWTVGASYDRYEQADFRSSHVNPKLGVQWDVDAVWRVRAAAVQVIKPALVGNRSLEPTQVAGFNQLFDDLNGTRSKRYGAALDWRARSDFKATLELNHRDMDEPLFDVFNGAWITEERTEQWYRLFADWAVSPRVALHAEVVYDRYRSEQGIATDGGNLPLEVVTWSMPVRLSYFCPSGLFANVGATWVDQTVRRSPLATQAAGSDRFTVVDASVGYRLPERRGVLSLAVRNLFDSDFRYQDDSYREFRDEPSIGPYFPERTVMGRFTTSF